MDIKSIDSEDFPTNTSQNEHFQSVVNRAVGRRGFLKFGSGAAVAAFLAGPSLDAAAPTPPPPPPHCWVSKLFQPTALTL